MGAINFETYSKGHDIQEAYSVAVDAAMNEYGTDHYNGTISTTIDLVDKTKEWKQSEKTLDDFVEEQLEKCPKWVCYGVCVDEPKGNELKVKTKVEHVVEKGTKKWVLKYAVECLREDKQLGKYNTKGEAVKVARAYTEKTGNNTSVFMEKVLEKGNTKVAQIIYKRSGKEKAGKYLLFGVASC